MCSLLTLFFKSVVVKYVLSLNFLIEKGLIKSVCLSLIPFEPVGKVFIKASMNSIMTRMLAG
jgi:hypothetical protein